MKFEDLNVKNFYSLNRCQVSWIEGITYWIVACTSLSRWEETDNMGIPTQTSTTMDSYNTAQSTEYLLRCYDLPNSRHVYSLLKA
jgi:hypothetical protein